MERLRPRRGRGRGGIVPPAPVPAPPGPAPGQPGQPPIPPAPAPGQAPIPLAPAPVPFVPPARQKDPPIFRGTPDEDVVGWMFRFEQVAEYNQWNQEQRLRVIGMSFEGVAQKWYCGLMLRIQPPNTFDALRTELFRAFKPVNYEDHLEVRLRSRQQGPTEPFTDYFHDVLYMCSRIEPNMPERVKIQHLYRGLPPATVRGIYRFITPASTTEDFFREVQVFLQGEDMATRQGTSSVPPSPLFHVREEVTPRAPVPPGPEQAPNTNVYVTKDDLETFGLRLLEKMGQHQTGVKNDRPSSQKNKGQEQGGRDRSGGETRNRRTRDGRPICNKCNRPGHIERNCYTKFPNEDPKSSTSSNAQPKPEPDAGGSQTSQTKN